MAAPIASSSSTTHPDSPTTRVKNLSRIHGEAVCRQQSAHGMAAGAGEHAGALVQMQWVRVWVWVWVGVGASIGICADVEASRASSVRPSAVAIEASRYEDSEHVLRMCSV